MKILKASEARNNFSELVSQAQFGGEPIVILRQGKKAAVLMGYDQFLSIQSESGGLVRDAADIEYRTQRLAKKIARSSPGWDTTKAIRKMRESRWSS